MQTTVDIDESVLREAEAEARKQGKPLARLIEEALRSIYSPPSGNSQKPPPTLNDDGLEANDPFFSALDEIRALGRMPAPHREINMS